MKTLLVYATNSGSTIEVSNYIAEEFTKKGLEIVVKDAREVQPDDFGGYDLVILGSPTWGEGNVHDLFTMLFDKAEGKSFEGKKFAVFGLGDKTYAHFCTSVDHLKDFVDQMKGQLVNEPLKIDNFYFNQQDEMPRITEWAQKVTTSIS